MNRPWTTPGEGSRPRRRKPLCSKGNTHSFPCLLRQQRYRPRRRMHCVQGDRQIESTRRDETEANGCYRGTQNAARSSLRNSGPKDDSENRPCRKSECAGSDEDNHQRCSLLRRTHNVQDRAAWDSPAKPTRPPIVMIRPISVCVHFWAVRYTTTKGPNPVCTSATKNTNQSRPLQLAPEGAGAGFPILWPSTGVTPLPQALFAWV